MEQPAKVNNILIAQAGTGTDQIGRFDIVVDEVTNTIIEWEWKLVPINDKTIEMDTALEEFINSYKDTVDEKYNAIVTRFFEKLTHLKRHQETPLGNMMADALADKSKTDVLLLGSGSIRGKELGPVVTLGSLKACFPYEDSLTKYTISGKQLKAVFSHIMRPENRNGQGEFFQINNQVKARYCDKALKLVSLVVKDMPVVNNQRYTITLQGYHVNNAKANLGISREDLMAVEILTVVSTSDYQVLEEWLRYNSNITRKVEGRLIFESMS